MHKKEQEKKLTGREFLQQTGLFQQLSAGELQSKGY